MPNDIGFFSYLRQAGNVKLHEPKSISPELYEQLKSAKKMIKGYIKGSDLKVDIYDSTTVPKDKFVYMRSPKSIYVEVTDLLKNKVETNEFWEQDSSGEHILRRIFRFIDKANGVEEEPMAKFIRSARTKYQWNKTKTLKENNLYL